MFNDFVDGVRGEIAGWSEDPNGEMMNGRALVKCWLA
jgi:peptide/nickel transport system substrate-binding protein